MKSAALNRQASDLSMTGSRLKFNELPGSQLLASKPQRTRINYRDTQKTPENELNSNDNDIDENNNNNTADDNDSRNRNSNFNENMENLMPNSCMSFRDDVPSSNERGSPDFRPVPKPRNRGGGGGGGGLNDLNSTKTNLIVTNDKEDFRIRRNNTAKARPTTPRLSHMPVPQPRASLKPDSQNDMSLNKQDQYFSKQRERNKLAATYIFNSGGSYNNNSNGVGGGGGQPGRIPSPPMQLLKKLDGPVIRSSNTNNNNNNNNSRNSPDLVIPDTPRRSARHRLSQIVNSHNNNNANNDLDNGYDNSNSNHTFDNDLVVSSRNKIKR